MAKTKISEFSATPANNTDIDSINISEGCAPSGINDAIRELMAQLKDFQTGAVGDSFNGPIGSSTASTGAFTTLSATGAITSTLATGTAPLVIASTTKVANLNVDLLDGADWASPAALGSTTPAAVSATTLSASSNVTLSGGTANGVAYLNGSKVLTSGSALTFDGTKLNNTSGVSAALIQSTDTGSTGSFLRILGDASSGNLINWTTGTALRWATSANDFSGFAEQMRLTSTGLGIGTSSPQAKLHVAQSASGVLFGQDSTTANIIGTNAAGTSSQGLFLKGFPLTFTGSGGGGTAQMTLNGDGNLGLGVTPSAWGGGFKAFETTGTSLGSNAAGSSYYLQNSYYNGTNFIYTTTLAASYYSQVSGQHRWYNAPSGTAGNAITFTQAMTLDADGDLGIGQTSPSYKLDVNNASGGLIGRFVNGAGRGNVRLDGYDDTTLQFYRRGASVGFIQTDSSGVDFIAGTAGAYPFIFYTNNTERARIDSSGNLLVGTTSASAASGGIYLRSKAVTGSSSVLIGHISATATGNSYAEFFLEGTGGLGSITQNGTTGVLYNITSDYRLKTVIGAVTGHGARIDALEPVEYTWNADGSRTRGFLAHKFQEVYAGSVTGTKDAVDADGNPKYQAMQAGSAEVIADLVAEIQSLRKRLADAGIA